MKYDKTCAACGVAFGMHREGCPVGLVNIVLNAAKGDWPDDEYEDVIDYLEDEAKKVAQKMDTTDSDAPTQ